MFRCGGGGGGLWILDWFLSLDIEEWGVDVDIGGFENVRKDRFFVGVLLNEFREFVVIVMVLIVEFKLELLVVLFVWFGRFVEENVDGLKSDLNDLVGVFIIGILRLDRFGELYELGIVIYVKLLVKEIDFVDFKELMLLKELRLCVFVNVIDEFGVVWFERVLFWWELNVCVLFFLKDE